MALILCRRKSDADLEESNNLCNELLAEIFVRLPTTAVVRFQVVCKQWYSLISSSHFIARFIHLRHHRDVQSSVFFQIRYYCDDRNCNCHEYHSEFHIISESSLLRNVYGDDGFSLSYLPDSARYLRLEGSFDDLILCSHFITAYEANYFVSNLLTKQWIALPPTHEHAEAQFVPCVGFLCVPPPCSECKPGDNALYKFMVVRLHPSVALFASSWFKIQVFSSEDSEWRIMDVSSPLALKGHHLDNSLVAYRGMLHWLHVDGMVVYDPVNNPRRFSRVIDLPIQFTVHDTRFFGVCQSCLRVVLVSKEHGAGYPIVDVWELEDYNSGLWNLVQKVYIKNLTYNGLPITKESTSFPLTGRLHPKNGYVIYLKIGNGVALVNIKTKIIERYYPLREKAAVHCWLDAFTLADQWWPTPVSSLLRQFHNAVEFHLADHWWPPLRH